MSLADRRRAVAAAEARLAASRARLADSWTGLKQEGAAAITPGRVVLVGLLSGFFGGVVADASDRSPAAPPGAGGATPLLPELLRLGNVLLPLLLPELAAAFRAGSNAADGEAAAPPPSAGNAA